MEALRLLCLFNLSICALLIIACETDPGPSDPCADNEWASVNRNGVDICLGVTEVTYFNANSNAAKIVFSAAEIDFLNPEIEADFSIPVDGVMLNTPYPVSSGRILKADPITEGNITLLVFDPPAQGKAGCIAGTFSLKSTVNGITTFEYTNGRFVYFKGEGTESYGPDDSCNPF